jgi:RHS repeat-associated protein
MRRERADAGVRSHAQLDSVTPTGHAVNPQGDSLDVGTIYPTRDGSEWCGGGTPVWVGVYIEFCALLTVYDSQLGFYYAPDTNVEHHYLFDACGNLAASGTSGRWHDNGEHPPGYISFIAGSSSTRIPDVPLECYGTWTVLYEFTETFTDGQSLTASATATFGAFRSETDAVAWLNAQASVTGGPIGPNEQLGNCGESHSTHAQVTDYPVDTATGNFWHTFSDLSLPGRGPAIDAQRTYNSALAQSDSAFGFGWSDWYGQHLSLDTDTVVLHGCSGAMTTFTLDNGAWTAPPRVLGALSHNEDGTWTYTRAAHEKYTFNSDGRLTSIADLNGETTRLTYPDADTRVVTDPSGRSVTFTFDNGHVASLHDSSTPQRTVSYNYDTDGNLSDVIDVGGGHWTFTYDNQHRMLTMRTPRFFGTTLTPDPVVTNHYDAQGRVDWQSDQLARKTTFDYTTVPGSTIVTNPAGNATEYDYNSDGLLVAEVRGYGSPAPAYWAYRYDPDTLGRRLVIDANGETWEASYEPDGDRATQTDPLGRVTRYSYNSFHEVASITSPRKINGNPIVTRFGYDAAGNPTSVSRPLLDQTSGSLVDTAVTTFEHADSAHPGDVTAIVDPNGHRTTQTFDANGLLSTVTRPPTAENPDGNKTTYRRDPSTGWVTSITSPRGNLTGADPAEFTTRFGHDSYGQVTWTRNPLWDAQSPAANQTVNDYDADGNLKSFTDGDGNATTYTYDPAGQRTKIHRADGTDVLTAYRPDGNIDVVTDGAQNQTKFQYDAFGLLQKRIDPMSRQTWYWRDRVGNIEGVGNPQRQEIYYSLNALGQVTSMSFASGGPTNVTNITYDEEGHRTGATDATGTSSWVYDSLGRLVSSTDGRGVTTGFHYDLGGRQKKVDYPNNAGSVVRTFDDADRLSALTDLAGQNFAFTYDADSNQAQTTYPNGTQTAFTVNAVGQTTAIDHALQASPNAPFASFHYTYDGASQVKTVTSTGVPADDHTYGYDQLNQLNSIDASSLTYDAAGNLTKGLDGLTRSYDKSGELTSATGPTIARVGTSSASGSSGSTLTLSLPAGIQANDQAIVAVSFPDGKTITGFTGYTLVATYKSGGTKAGQVAIYRRTLTAGETTATVSFQGKFDKSAVLGVYRNVDPNNPVRAVAGGGSGGLSAAVLVNGVTANKGDQLIWLSGANVTAGTWTPPSEMTLRQAEAGTSTDAMLADETLSTDGATGMRYATHSTAATLSAALVALRPAAITYSWTATGRRSTVTDTLSPNGSTTTHVFDNAGELAGSTVGSSPAVNYTYNLDGLRSTKTSGTTTTTYAWDQTAPNPNLLSDGAASYVYGPSGVPLERATSASNVTYYAQDLLGSTRAVTDSAGAVQGTYTYDAYGNTTAKTGSLTNPITYAGQYQDSETGYLYLRTRYYDPATASFLSRDPLEDSTGTPYSYANNNPVNSTDPSGLCPPCAIIAAGLIGGAIDVGFQALDNVLSGCDPLHDINWGEAAFFGGLSAATGGAATWLRSGTVAAKGDTWLATRLAMRNERGAIGIPGGTGRLTNSQAGDLANWLGYTRVKGTSHGQAIFTNGKNFITQDVDGHIGGTWKMARTPDAFSKQQRLGTYDYELNWIGG